MANVTLRPDLRTAGGEVNDIMCNGRFVGTVSLVYREYDRVSGSIQLESGSLRENEKEDVISYMHDYMQSLVDATQAEECDVIVTYSGYERIITAPMTDEEMAALDEEDWIGDEPPELYTPEENDAIEMLAGEQRAGFDEGTNRVVGGRKQDNRQEAAAPGQLERYQLVIVGENRGSVEYHIYDGQQELLAEALIHIRGWEASGDFLWRFRPSADEVESATDLLVSDFDDEQVLTFKLQHKHDGEIVETIELTHEDWLDEGEFPGAEADGAADDDYSVIMVRDDGDMLTYEIYQQTHGGLPIGTATVDISQRQLTGFIDFRDEDSRDDAEIIAALLMQELDKEKEYETVNLTMIYQNEPFDEILFETEKVH